MESRQACPVTKPYLYRLKCTLLAKEKAVLGINLAFCRSCNACVPKLRVLTVSTANACTSAACCLF